MSVNCIKIVLHSLFQYSLELHILLFFSQHSRSIFLRHLYKTCYLTAVYYYASCHNLIFPMISSFSAFLLCKWCSQEHPHTFFFFARLWLFPQHTILFLERLYCIQPCQYKRIHPFSSCFYKHWEFFFNWHFVGLIISSSYFIFAFLWLQIIFNMLKVESFLICYIFSHLYFFFCKLQVYVPCLFFY